MSEWAKKHKESCPTCERTILQNAIRGFVVGTLLALASLTTAVLLWMADI